MRAISVLVCAMAAVAARTDLSGIRPTLKPLRLGPPRSLPEDMSRILDNNLAQPCQLPYQALVRSNLKYIGAGSLITPISVLTSATAVIGYVEWSILLGTVNLLEPKEEDTPWSIKSTWAIPHPDYNATHYHNNVAVIMMPKKVPLGDCIKLVALPSPKEVHEMFTGETALVSGWGFSPNSQMVSDDLIFAEVVIVPNDLCKTYYAEGYVNDDTVCAANENRGIDNGDSGAPLVLNTTNGYLQIGVASFWSVSSSPSVPAAYVRITSVLDWIRNVAGNVVHL